MGNRIIYEEKTEYDRLEGSIGGISLVITFIAAVSFIFIYVCCCCEGSNNPCKCRRENNAGNREEEGCCKGCWTTENLHNILAIVYANFKEFRVQTTGNNDNASQTLVISDRKAPYGCIGCSAYTYYIYMMFMSFMWFFATAIDFSIYRKTTTCNDINVDVKSFRCFDVNNNSETINCEIPGIEDKQVICYLYSPNIAGLGVAFSTAKLISVVADIGYRMIFKITNKNFCCAILWRPFFIAVAIIAFIAYIILTQTTLMDTYFIFGVVPMRVAQLLLLCLTVGGILLLPPWCQYSDDDYKKKYYNVGYGDVESNSNHGMFHEEGWYVLTCMYRIAGKF